MEQEVIECIAAVASINEDMTKYCIDSDPNSLWVWVETQISSEGHCVVFLGETIYNNNNDERELLETTGSVYVDEHQYQYEPIEGYLRKKINELITKLSVIKL